MIPDKAITFVTGKGGVGKSNVTAALGLMHAAVGRKTLVCELGSDGHLARVLGKAITHKPTFIERNLDAANFVASEGLVSTLSSFVPFARLVRAVVQNRILQLFLETAPSISEAVLLDAIANLRAQYERVVVELPASGHALTLLRVPEMLRRLVTRGPIAKKANELEAAILSPETAQIVLVSLPEALPVQETIELAEKLRTATRVPVSAVLLNQTMSPLVPVAERALLQKLSDASNASSLRDHMHHMLDAARRDDRARAELIEKLQIPVYALPHVMVVENPIDILGPMRTTLAS